jgi:hypothetical protein
MVSVQVPLGYRSIDEILIGELGWRRISTRRGRLAPEATGARGRAVARSGGRTAYVWDAEPGERLPEAVARRSARDAMEEVSPGALLIFTDFLCRREVWQWVEEVDGIGVLREVSRRPAAMVVARCQCSKVSRSSEDSRRCNEDLRPRAIVISSQQEG